MLAVVRDRSGFLEKPDMVVRGNACRLPWAWDGLCFGVAMNEAGNEGWRDVVNNLAPTVIHESSWIRDNRGNPVYSPDLGGATYGYIEYADSPVHDRPSTAFTVYIRVMNRTSPQAQGGLFCNVFNGSSQPWCTWTIQGDDINPDRVFAAMALSPSALPEYVGSTSTGLPQTEFASLFFRWRSGEPPSLDILGERGNLLESLVHGSTLSGSLAYASGQGIRLNATEVEFTNYDAVYSQAMVWNRKLNDQEMTALVADPFGWYAPRRETVSVAAPFPVGPGMAAPGMLTIR